MEELLNTLFVMTQGTYLRLDHQTIKAEVEREKVLQIPLHHLHGITVFGNVLVSPFLIQRCGEEGRTIAFFDKNGRFKARIVGPTSGNVLLRQSQYEASRSQARALAIARNIVAGKIQNARQLVLRAAREADRPDDSTVLTDTASTLARLLPALQDAGSLDRTRGIEGAAAKAYFQTFEAMIKAPRDRFGFSGRLRRPPRDPVNALLSFLYAILLNDCVSALEGVGLDPQIGFLHAPRPGRPGLGLDLMEEFRAGIADRLALTLLNRRQLGLDSFQERLGGAVLLNEKGRRTTVVAYQKRKQEEVTHPFLNRRVFIGLISHLQARILARHLRGDLDAYIPFLVR